MKTGTKIAATIAAYVAGVLLTYGHIYNAGRICSMSAPPYQCDAPVDAAVKAIYWPLYWPARGAIYITNPETWS